MNIFRRHFWRNLQYNISAFFFPRQKWLTKAIGNKWLDKDALLEIINGALIIHFVEEEKAFENTDWSYNRSRAEHPIKSAYHWFKWGRKNVQKHIEDLYRIMPTTGWNADFLKAIDLPEVAGDYQEWQIYMQELENKLDKRDTSAIISLAKFKNCLWT